VRATLAVVFLAVAAGSVQHQRSQFQVLSSRFSVRNAEACFLLLDSANGSLARNPDAVCDARLPPASTFKIPHAIAALDSAVIKSAEEVIRYDGTPRDYATWRRDHTLASAMRYSVVWYFQEIAKRLGMDREEFYLRRLQYGNADPSSGLTTFWLGGSLRISPIEQMTFLRRLYDDELPVAARVTRTVRDILIQPNGVVVNANGEHPFDAPWPNGTQVSAKTGSTSFDDRRAVRWIVGHVKRGSHEWIFVSCVSGGADVDANAAIDLAARSLREHGVL
jgi:beta-lactamase class D